ncbi:hypothetical protein L484_000348 [Morus notabilis]|uniref:Uncharacterized protein n=1 Tax=Morus notabilis TaxID=981085 RepID=W9SM28_9ROSA|nr:hypothetical protein L484_000348 [Morus notabilis]
MMISVPNNGFGGGEKLGVIGMTGNSMGAGSAVLSEQCLTRTWRVPPSYHPTVTNPKKLNQL